MITAVLKQHIGKRQRILGGDYFKKMETTAHDDSVSIRKSLHLTWKHILIASLIIICSLLLLAFKTNPFDFMHWNRTNTPPVLPPDPYLEAALFNYSVPENLRQENEDSVPAMPESVRIKDLNIVYYQVAKGDSIAKIAEKFKLRIDTLISFNNLKNAKSITAGIKLAIPDADGLKYKVKRGDNLSGIANRFKISLNTLLDWNGIDSDKILPGTEYFIPGARLSKNELNSILGTLFIYPVQGQLTSAFGARLDPITGVKSYHYGIDLMNAKNTPIKAVMDGTVAIVSSSNLYGKYIILNHSGGYQSLYGHLNKAGVTAGQKVSQGQVLGYMGNTGYSTGTHLHLSIYKNGDQVDPLKYLK